MTHAEFMARLLPPESYDSNGPLVNADLEVSGSVFDAIQARVVVFLREIDPRTVAELLPDWERVYGLPDPCVPLQQTVAQRVAALVAKVLEIGGLSRAYYLAQAAALGYPDATIDEFVGWTCDDACDEELLGEEWRFVWRLNIPQAVAIANSTCNTTCNEPLRAWGNDTLNCVMARIKPAHTLALITYEV